MLPSPTFCAVTCNNCKYLTISYVTVSFLGHIYLFFKHTKSLFKQNLVLVGKLVFFISYYLMRMDKFV